MTNPLLPASARAAGRTLVWTLVGLLAVLVGCVIWIGVRGALAYEHLRAAESAARAVAAEADDPTRAAPALQGITDDASAAHDLTSDPIWTAAQALPWIGPQLHAVAVVSEAAADVTASALAPLSALATEISGGALRPVDGRFDLSGLAELHNAIAVSAPALDRAAASVDGIDRAALVAPLATRIEAFGRVIDSARAGIDAADRASTLMPAMLGADGPRNYLVVFQNNAEWRSLGGIVGAMAVIHAEDGAISLTAQGSSSDFPKYTPPVLDLGAELVAIHGTKPAQYVQNATQVASFPRAAQIAQEMWAQKTGLRVDGVIALDPVTLSYILAATGPIPLPSGDVLSADNALALLLNEVYRRYPNPPDQDAFFQTAAATVFAAIARGTADPAALLTALADAGQERRLLVWSQDPGEQSVLEGTTLQGDLPVTDAAQTTFGVYLNDGTGSKMDYYMHVASGAAWCAGATGGNDATLEVTLRADGPADAATLPAYITGGGGFGVAPGVTRTVAYLYLPTGATLVSSTETGPGTTAGFGSGTDSGRPVLIWESKLAPGEQATATIRVRTPETASVTAQVTPILPGHQEQITDVCGVG